MRKVEILNTSILTADGKYALHTIDLDDARELVRGDGGYESAVGHESTAQILTTLLGVDVPVNRIVFEQTPDQAALVFKLNGRPPEGAILTAEQIQEIGYSFKLLERLS
jgi:hypothetical protein